MGGTPNRPRRRHKWLRRIFLGLLGLILFVFSLVLAVLLAADTKRGHDFIRTTALRIVNEKVLAGRVEVDHLDGWLYGDITLRGIRLFDRDGRPAVTVDAINVLFDLGSLLEGGIRVAGVRVIHPTVHAMPGSDGKLNLATLVKTSTPAKEKEPSEPSTFEVALERIELERGEITYASGAGEPLEVHGLYVLAGVVLQGGVIDAELLRLALNLAKPPLPLVLTAKAHLDGDALTANADASIAEARLHTSTIALDLKTLMADGRVELHVPPALLTRLGLDPQLRPALDLGIDVKPGTAQQPWRGKIDGQLSGAPIRGAFDLGPEGGDASLRFEGLDPRAIHAAAPNGKLQLALSAALPEWTRGTVKLDVRGPIDVVKDRVAIAPLTAVANLSPGRVNARADLTVRGVSSATTAAPGVRAVITAGVALEPAGARIERADVKVEANQLDKLMPKTVPVGGRHQVWARASGPTSDLAVTASVSSRRLAAGGARINSLGVQASVSGIPKDPEGRVRVSFDELTAAGMFFPRGEVRADVARGGRAITATVAAIGDGFIRRVGVGARVARNEADTTIDVPQLDVATASASWHGYAKQVVLHNGGDIGIETFTIGSPMGRITARGRINPSRLARAPGRLEVAIERLDLAALAPFAPALGSLSGKIDLTAQMSTGKRGVSAHAELGLADVRRMAGGPLTGSLSLDLDQRKVKGAFQLGGEGTGAIQASGTGIAPPDPFVGAAWKDAELTEASVTLDRLDLSRLVAFTSTSPSIRGVVTGSVAVGRKMRDVRATVAARGFQAPMVKAPLDIAIFADANPSRVLGRVAAQTPGFEPIVVELDTNVGTEALLSRGADVLRDDGTTAKVRLDSVPLPVIARLAGLDPTDPRFDAPRGSISAEIQGRGGTTSPWVAADVRLSSAAMGRKAPRVDLTLHLEAQEGRGILELDAALERSGRVRAAGQAVLPALFDTAAWRAMKPEALERFAFHAEDFRLGAIMEMGLAKHFPDGRFDANVELGRGLSRGDLALRVADLDLDQRLAPMAAGLQAKLEPAKVTVSATVGFADWMSGTSTLTTAALSISGKVNTGIPALFAGGAVDPELEVHVDSDHFPLEQAMGNRDLGKLVGGELSVTATVAGRISAPRAHLDVLLEKAVLGGSSFGTVQAKLDLDPEMVRANAVLAQQGKGKLRLDAEVKDFMGGAQPDLQADLQADRFDLGFVGDLIEGLASSALGVTGVLDGKMHVAGMGQDAKLRGKLTVDQVKAFLPMAMIPPIEETQVTIAVAEDGKLSIDGKGEMGGGKFGIDLDGQLPSLASAEIDGKLTTDGIRLSAAGKTLEVDTEVKLHATRDPEHTRVDIDIAHTDVTMPIRAKQKNLRAIESFDDLVFVDELGLPEPEVQVTRVGEGRPTFAMTIKTSNPIAIRNEEIEANAYIDLAMGVDPTKPGPVGSVVIDQGRVKVLSWVYDVSEARVEFDGRTPPDPRLAVQLEKQFQSMTFLIQVSGSAKEPQLRLTSDPDRDQTYLVTVLLGTDPDQPTLDDPSLEQRAKSLATGFLASQLKNQLQGRLPVDTIEIDLGDQTRSGSIMAGKWVTDSVFLAYTYRFEPQPDENSSEGILRWRFARGWTLEARLGDKANGSLDALWLKRW